MGSLAQDLKTGLRALARRPAVTGIALAVLALGIGANTAMFSVVHAVLLRPLPFPEPERIVMVWNYNPLQGFPRDVTSYPNFLDWKAGGTGFDSLAAFYTRALNLVSGTSGDDDPVEVEAAEVSAAFFDVVGVAPALGRGFLPEEEQQGNHRSVILSHGLWQRRFGSDRSLVGRPIELTGERYTVVGVMPPGFELPRKVELWVPLAPGDSSRNARGSFWLHVIGRLKPGSALSMVQAELDTVATRLATEYPLFNEGTGIRAVRLQEDLVGDVRPILWVLLAAVATVLLIACANLANLLLARAAEREREFALRAALGAGAGRILRQLLVESTLLAVAGGACGVLLAGWAAPLLFRLAARELPQLPPPELSLPVLAFSLLVAVATGFLFGLAPALQLSRARVALALKEGARGSSGGPRGRRLRGVLVAAEIALALVLLVGAGLLLKSLSRLAEVDLGLETEKRLTLRVQLPPATYGEVARRIAFFDELLARVEALPGVRAVGASSDVLLDALPNSTNVTAENRPPEPALDRQIATQDSVSAGFFHAIGMKLVAGETFRATDTSDAPPVAVINQAMARRYWGDEDPLGRRFKYGGLNSQDPWRTVIGVVADSRRSGQDQAVMPSTYLPFAQAPRRSLTFVVATEGDPLALLPAIRREVARLDRSIPVAAVSTLERLVAERLLPRRFQALLLGLFAGLAFLLAAIGVYGVIAYLVEQRTREISVRMALGAPAGRIVRLVLGQILALALPGLAVGLVAAFASTRVLRSQLFGVSPGDPQTFAAVAALLGGVALLAGYIPARRAARMNPADALKRE